jgi:hypothetical protein
MTMMRSIGPYLQRLLPAVIVLLTVSCGARVPGTTVPGTTVPGTTVPATSATPTTSEAPGATATRSPGATSVIFGVVRVGPTCAGDPVYHACRPHPLSDVEVQARSPSGGVIASARTKSDGHYSLELGPGSYVLVVVTTQVFPECRHVPVSSGSAGAAIRADINCDAGQRHLGPPATNPRDSAVP